MKLIQFSTTLSAGVLIGVCLGWGLKPQPETASGEGPEAALARPRPPRPATEGPKPFATELQAIKDGNFKLKRDGSDKDSAYLEALAAALLKSCGGYSRMESEEKRSFDRILTAMALKNLERTLDWIDQSLDGKDRAKNYREAIQTAMKDSPVRERLDLFKGRGFTPEEIETYAGNLMMGSETLSTETALYLQGHVQSVQPTRHPRPFRGGSGARPRRGGGLRTLANGTEKAAGKVVSSAISSPKTVLDRLETTA
jgi:hypothetical protein